MASAGQCILLKRNICDITRQLALASDSQRWPALAIAGQRNLSKKNICDITPQLAMASDNQRWPAMVSDCQFICRKRISAILLITWRCRACNVFEILYIDSQRLPGQSKKLNAPNRIIYYILTGPRSACHSA